MLFLIGCSVSASRTASSCLPVAGPCRKCGEVGRRDPVLGIWVRLGLGGEGLWEGRGNWRSALGRELFWVRLRCGRLWDGSGWVSDMLVVFFPRQGWMVSVTFVRYYCIYGVWIRSSWSTHYIFCYVTSGTVSCLGWIQGKSSKRRMRETWLYSLYYLWTAGIPQLHLLFLTCLKVEAADFLSVLLKASIIFLLKW